MTLDMRMLEATSNQEDAKYNRHLQVICIRNWTVKLARDLLRTLVDHSAFMAHRTSTQQTSAYRSYYTLRSNPL